MKGRQVSREMLNDHFSFYDKSFSLQEETPLTTISNLENRFRKYKGFKSVYNLREPPGKRQHP